jgi:hypothetical protein
MQLRAVAADGKVLLELVWRDGVSDQAGGEEAPGTLQTPTLAADPRTVLALFCTHNLCKTTI